MANAIFYARGLASEINNRANRPTASETRASSAAAIGHNTHVKVVPNTVGFRAVGDERVDRLIHHISHEVGLRFSVRHRIIHRAGLVDNKENARGIVAADFSGISQNCPQILRRLLGCASMTHIEPENVVSVAIEARTQRLRNGNLAPRRSTSPIQAHPAAK
ncbi:hypothetical protein D3C85_1120650 [compost metagenome]